MDYTFTPNVTGPVGKRVRASNIDDHQWQPYHDKIRTKYLDEKLTLTQLRQYMRKTYLFSPSKKQYTSYFTRWKIHKIEKCGGHIPDIYSHTRTPSNARSPTSDGDQASEAFSKIVTVSSGLEPVADLPKVSEQDVKFLQEGLILSGLPPLHPRSYPPESVLDYHFLDRISGNQGGHDRRTSDSTFIRRTADATLFSVDAELPQVQQIFDHLQEMIDSRPADLYCHDFHVSDLLHMTRILVQDPASSHLQRLSRRTFLLICSVWNQWSDIPSRGLTFMNAITKTLLRYDVARPAQDSLHRPQSPPVGGPIAGSLAETIHRNCSTFISGSKAARADDNWSQMLLGLLWHPFCQRPKTTQIEYVASFVHEDHVHGLSRILLWCTSVLTGPSFSLFRQNFVDSCWSIPGQDGKPAAETTTLERHILHYYLVSFFWRLRARARYDSAILNEEECDVLSTFNTFLNDLGISKSDVVIHLVDLFVPRFDPLDTVSTANPNHLNPHFLSGIYSNYRIRCDIRKRKEIAAWWLSLWVWNQLPKELSDSGQSSLKTRLGTHTLTLISQDIEQTHPCWDSSTRTKQPATAEILLPTLYQGMAGSRKSYMYGLKENSQAITPTSQPQKHYSQRSSDWSSDYVNFFRSGTKITISPKQSPALPSDGFLDVHEEISEISKKWNFSGSCKRTGSGSQRSISGFDVRGRVGIAVHQHRGGSSGGQARAGAKTEDILQHSERCMSPRVMTGASMRD